MPETSCIPLSSGLDYTQAAISEPLAIGLYAVKNSAAVQNANIGILGFGPIGMSVLLPARAAGVNRIYVTDKIRERLEIAKKTGVHWGGNPDAVDVVSEIKGHEPLLLDIVYECCGQQDAMDQAIELIKPGGKIMIVGIPEAERWSFNADLMRRKEITLINVRRQLHCTEDALRKIDQGVLDVSSMATHHFSFDRTKEAFELVARYGDGVMKAMIEFD
jgi:L-iditol 2-dehydrogenase